MDPTPDQDAAEVVDALDVVVVDEAAVLAPVRSSAVPAVQAAALAATGFVAGAATVAVVSRRRNRGALKRRKKKKGGAIGEIVSSNSFLVDVHLLRRD
jgi:pyridoxal biosynthesis lyase PdxS